MKKTTLNTVEDSDNKQTVIANQNEKINDSARRISDADDDEDETDDTDDDEETEYDINEDSEELFEAVADECGCDVDDAKKIVAVARLNGDSFDDISSYSCSVNSVYVGSSREYLVYDDYSEAERDAEQDVLDLIDDMGLESFSPSFQDTIIMKGWLDTDWFEQAMDESNRFYAEDIESESSSTSANRLIEECVDADIISDDEIDEDGEYTGNLDLIDEYVEYLNNRESDPVEWYRMNFGDRELADIVKQNNLLDEQRVAEECVALDGVAHSLASYDGNENEETVDGSTYYIYRTN